MKRLNLPNTVVTLFVSKKVLRPAILLGLVFGVYVVASVIGFTTNFTTSLAREQLAQGFGNNPGLAMLLGTAHQIDTPFGFAVWRSLGVLTIVGAIWGLMTATKTLRGQEDLGRWELFLSGQTSFRLATLSALLGLLSSLAIMFVLITSLILGVATFENTEISISSSMVFALALISSTAEFLSVGALMSQLLPTRRRAVTYSAALFGIFFILRAIADTSSNFSWLLNISPLGWIEKLQPITNNQPLWLIPIFGFVIILGSLTVYLSGRRDPGAGILADRDTARPRTWLLNSPILAAIRLTSATTLGWLAATAFLGGLMGGISKTAGDATSGSSSITHALGEITQVQKIGVLTFLGILFFLIMILIMVYVTNAIGAMREDEAQGYLDNFLTRPVSRMRWVTGRLALIAIATVIIGLTAGVFSWIGSTSQGNDVSLHDLLIAGINACAPGVLVLGVGMFVLGVRPRLTVLVLYFLIAWSFLLEMIGPILNLDQRILDTSPLHHVTLAPLVNPDWNADIILVMIGLILLIVGVLGFNKRDLASE